MVKLNFKKNENGSISIIMPVFIILICIFMIIVFDFSKIFIKREKTENIAEMLSLAVSQELLSFRNNNIHISDILGTDQESLKDYEIDIRVDYDEVIVTAKTPLNLVFIDRLLQAESISSTSVSEILYPWSDDFDFCKKYKFNF
ncbi:MAG TPA: hypothetical protein DCY00_01630 [Actinobacteria bacterium]|nr:hypothetical protein [Actinomycetota bacterium]